jgi:hypothetical protein
VDLTASYLSDALGNLIDAVAELLRKGVRESRCSWDEEPGEYRWIFTRDRRTIHVRILAFNELHGDEPDDQGRLLFETVQPVEVVGQAVVDCATAVLERHGECEYREKWVEHPFPFAQLQLLKDRLNPTHGKN